ncbi:MAG TPA: PASTA domain-containing protein [Candidatus Acidoferrales bacterium]|jgi:eukaryotic-like serine/threonine-protein kinase
MKFRDRMEWIFRIALLAFILMSVAFLSAITAMRFAIQGREVVMPNVVGQKMPEAEQMLRGRGIGVQVEDRTYNPVPVDMVLRQSPPPGMKVKVGQSAHVIVSLGPQSATIPTLIDLTLRTARIELLRGGLQTGEVSSAYLGGTGNDVVLQQDPAPGTSNVTSPHVDMLVSLGPRPAAYVMPELIGQSLNEAESKLTGIGLKSPKLTLTPLPGGLHGTVLGQTPARGARLEASTQVELQIAE